MGLKGIVNTLPDAKGNLFVQCGIMRTQANIKDLVPVEEETILTPSLKRTSTGKIKMSKSLSVSTEINLLGKTVDEALAILVNIWMMLIWHTSPLSGLSTVREPAL